MANKDRSRKSGARKRKFYGNQHSVSSRNASRVECGSGDVNLSASARKLRFALPQELRWAETASDPDSTSDNDTSSDDEASELAFSAGNGSAGTRLLDLGELQRALDSTACCKRCKAGSLVLEESRREGLASVMRFRATSVPVDILKKYPWPSVAMVGQASSLRSTAALC